MKAALCAKTMQWIERGDITMDPIVAIRGLSSGLRSHRDWLRQHKIRGALLGAGLYMVGSGLWDIGLYRRTGPLTKMDISQIHAGVALPSRWLSITGRALPKKIVGFGTSEDHLDEAYVPLVPKGCLNHAKAPLPQKGGATGMRFNTN